jgi:hypothetical protein
MSWNESEILEARRAILDAAQDMLAGRLAYIEGARKIVATWWRSKLDERDADFLPFVGIDSETELGRGPARPPRWRSHLRSNPKIGLKLHNGLASAGRSAVL